MTRFSTGLIAAATAAVFVTFASMADAQQKSSAKSKCNAITEETACKADATCIWVPAATNAKTGKERKAYCKTKPAPAKKKAADKS